MSHRCDFCGTTNSTFWVANHKWYPKCGTCGHTHELFACYDCILKPKQKQILRWIMMSGNDALINEIDRHRKHHARLERL